MSEYKKHKLRKLPRTIKFHYKDHFVLVYDSESNRVQEIYTKDYIHPTNAFNKMAEEGKFDDYVMLPPGESELKIGTFSFEPSLVIQRMLTDCDKRLWLSDWTSFEEEDRNDELESGDMTISDIQELYCDGVIKVIKKEG